jgi:hypothetical protein
MLLLLLLAGTPAFSGTAGKREDDPVLRLLAVRGRDGVGGAVLGAALAVQYEIVSRPAAGAALLLLVDGRVVLRSTEVRGPRRPDPLRMHPKHPSSTNGGTAGTFAAA